MHRIKLKKLADPAKLDNVRHELHQLMAIRTRAELDFEDLGSCEEQLFQINRQLWTAEDELRSREHARDFGTGFVELARLV